MALMEVKVMLGREAREFIVGLPQKAQDKVIQNIKFIEGGGKNPEVFCKLSGTDGIWEFRTLHGKTCYRILAFWDETRRSVILATHGFVKKTQKTPQNEIAKAEAIKSMYYQQHKK